MIWLSFLFLHVANCVLIYLSDVDCFNLPFSRYLLLACCVVLCSLIQNVTSNDADAKAVCFSSCLNGKYFVTKKHRTYTLIEFKPLPRTVF